MQMKYIGNGAFVPPIPARDLTAAEVEEFGAETLLKTGLYEVIDESKKPAKPAKKEGDS